MVMSSNLEKLSTSYDEDIRNSSSSSENVVVVNNKKETINFNSEIVEIEENAPPSVYNYKEDPDNPMNWPKGRKYSGLVIVMSICFMSYFSSSIYVPASHDIMVYFDTDLTTINATFSLFLLMNGIAPLFWAPLSERVGRKWIYIIAMALYTVCTILCGISTNLGMFFAFRVLQGTFACVGQAVGGGSVSDIFEPHERGKALSYYILSLILGPPVATVVGGYLDQYLGWRWIFYLMTIMGGTLTLSSYFFLKETLYRPNEKQLLPPSNLKDRLQRVKFNPFTTLALFKNPDVVLVCLPIGIAFGWFYFFVTILPSTFGPIYNFSPGTVGLCYVAGGLGNATGSICAGCTSDKYYAKAVAKNNGVAVKEFRLGLIFFVIPCILVGPILYGWFLHTRLHWIAPLIAFAISTFGIMFTITIASTYLVDSNLKKAASVVSVNNFSRSIFAMLFSLTAVQLRGSLGDGWVYTFMALMSTTAYLICIPLVLKYGEKWKQIRS